MSIPHKFAAESAGTKPVRAERADTGAESNAETFTDADAVAVRAIARYNVERRQAGEAPLDLKGIARFRQIVTESIERYEVLKKTTGDEIH
jgi:hypothetical protein